MRIFDGDQSTDSDDYEEISDSNEITARLLKDNDFDTDACQANLTKQQKAVSLAFVRMLEEHTCQTGFYYRYRLRMPAFCDSTQMRERVFMGDKTKLGEMIFGFFKKGMVKGWKKKGIC